MINAPHDAMIALEARVRADLARTLHPKNRWVAPRMAPDGSEALDVLIVGGGQSGLAVAFSLSRAMVERVLILDKAEKGREGPWRTYARMATLRSPKDMPGPDLGIASLTYESWHEARFGRADFDHLAFIRKLDWADYLDWFRDITAAPVTNGAEVIDLEPVGGLIAATVLQSGVRRVIFARKVVLCTGQESTGDWMVPAPLKALSPGHVFSTNEQVHFTSFAAKDIVILGAGASAFDNAGTALEAGARSVKVLCRRIDPQIIQPYRWLTFTGFLKHLGDMPDVWRWRFMRHVMAMREGFPQMTWDRCAVHNNFELVTGAEVRSAEMVGGRVHLTTGAGSVVADAVIPCIGIDMDFASRPELRRVADNIATWADCYTPPDDERDERLGAFPYLGPDFELTEKQAGRTPWIRDIRLFSIASTMSFGPSGSSLNAMTSAVPKLVDGLTRDFFAADLDHHWKNLQAFDIPAAVLRKPPRAAAE